MFPKDSNPNADAETDLIPTFADSVIIIPHPEVAVLDIEHTHTLYSYGVHPVAWRTCK
jgi:hypothetical protein